MSASVRWSGLAEFQRELHALPETLTDEARPITRTAADTVARATLTQVARRSGDLAAGITVSSRRGAASVVRSGARYAGVYESGSRGARATSRGWNRGVMPAARVLVPAAIRARQGMRDRLVALVRREGLTVTGA